MQHSMAVRTHRYKILHWIKFVRFRGQRHRSEIVNMNETLPDLAVEHFEVKTANRAR